MPPTRINKYLSENGYCSRREADRLIEAGRVFINGKRAKLGDRMCERDKVRVEGRDKRKPLEKIYLLLNKPIGIIVTADHHIKNNILDFVHFSERLFPVGQLDVNTEGLILLTNDRVFLNRLLHPKYEQDKEYVVELDRRCDMKDIRIWKNGIELEDGMTLPAKVRKIDDFRFAIILNEGRHRQIQRMCEALGFHVVLLKRTRILTLKLSSQYPIGSWRMLTDSEVRDLKKAVGMKV